LVGVDKLSASPAAAFEPHAKRRTDQLPEEDKAHQNASRNENAEEYPLQKTVIHLYFQKPRGDIRDLLSIARWALSKKLKRYKTFNHKQMISLFVCFDQFYIKSGCIVWCGKAPMQPESGLFLLFGKLFVLLFHCVGSGEE
jgi:hypothetical protein